MNFVSPATMKKQVFLLLKRNLDGFKVKRLYSVLPGEVEVAPAATVTVEPVITLTHANVEPNVEETVLVTGASGCVGQHIVSLLSLHEADKLKKIKVLDINPFVSKLELNESVPIEAYETDLRNRRELEAAMEDVDTVIHTGSLVSVGPFADTRAMQQVNVEGTKNIVDACLKFGVKRLIYTSSVEVAIGPAPIYGGNEEDVPVPPPNGEFLLGQGYPKTKWLAEKTILDHDGANLLDGSGKQLSTVALRITMQYGEQDNHVITTSLLRASKVKGSRLPWLKLQHDLLQATYAGNSAWAHVCALRSLRQRPEECRGMAYYVTDDTRLQQTFEFLSSFMVPCGFTYMRRGIPYHLAYLMVGMQETAAKLFQPWIRINISESSHGLKFLNHIHFFQSSLAKEKLGYSPMFDREESMKRSLDFYLEVAEKLRNN